MALLAPCSAAPRPPQGLSSASSPTRDLPLLQQFFNRAWHLAALPRLQTVTAPRATRAVKHAAPRRASLHGGAQRTLLQCGQLQAAAGSRPPQARLCERLQLSSFLPALPSTSFCPYLDAQVAAGLKWGTPGSVLGPCSPSSSEGQMRRQLHPCLAGEAKLGGMGEMVKGRASA